MREYIKKKYKGMGFAEALIALMIVGIVGIVLMQIASSTLRELVLLDTEDALARYAISTSVDLQKIAIEDMGIEEEDKKFNRLGEDTTHCFGINPEGSDFITPVFDCPSKENNNGEDFRDDYSRIYEDKNGDGSFDEDEKTQYFRIINVKDITDKRAVIEIITGVYNMKGLNTTNKDVKDYRYLVVIAR